MKNYSEQENFYIAPRIEHLVVRQDARICDTSMEDYEVGDDQDVDWDS